MSLHGKLLNILMPAQCQLVTFLRTWKAGSWSMMMVFIPVLLLCIAEYVGNFSWLFTIKYITDTMYSHGLW